MFQAIHLLFLFTATWLAVSNSCQMAAGGKPKDLGEKSFATPMVSTVPLTLHDLSEKADQIFLGRVVAVSRTEKSVLSGGKEILVPTREISFKPSKVLKGELAVGKTFVVTQYEEFASPVKLGEEVLWYLPKPSKTGFVTPVGYHAGHFVVYYDSRKHPVAINLRGNVGLWPEEEVIAKGKVGPNEKELAEVLRRMDMPSARIEDILKVANLPYAPRELPLELILAATEFYLRKGK